MTMMNEQERAREQRGRSRKLTGALMALVVGLGMSAGALGYYRAGLFGGGATAVVVGVGIGLTVIAAIKAWKMRPWDRRWQAEAVHARRDRLQAGRSRILWALPLVSMAFLAVAFGAWEGVQAGDDAVIDYVQVGLPVLYAWVVAAVVMGWDFQSRSNREYLDDELTGTMRARALGAAFVVLMGAGTVALGITLWRLDWAVPALISALTLGGAAAGLRFAWLDREAGLPEKGDG
jgi:hypothetical protein